MKKINLTINSRRISGPEGMTILELAQENGIDIPTLCYRPELTPIGACRICVVEVAGSPTLVGACHTPISEGMVIHTHSPKALAARRAIVELLLASHPDSCFVCDQANICELRQIAADLEVGLSRFRSRKRYYPIEDVSSDIVRDLSKCILCRRCVRACREIAGQDVLSIAHRGFGAKIVVDTDQPLNKNVCRDCDICISICPTGALRRPKRVSEEKTGKPLVISEVKGE